MAKMTRIKVSDPDGTDEEIVELEFKEEEWAILKDFAEYAVELESNSLIKEGVSSPQA
jgi:hypothetical protein